MCSKKGAMAMGMGGVRLPRRQLPDVARDCRAQVVKRSLLASYNVHGRAGEVCI